jgi:hypothetical protein
MSHENQVPTIAFFGATGGCAKACLVYALRAGIKTVALARAPLKLKNALLEQGVTQETLDSKLQILEGDARDSAIVKKVLQLNDTSGQLVDGIVSGIGAQPIMTFSLKAHVDNPHVNEETTSALIAALDEIEKQYPRAAKPWITVISATGVAGRSSTRVANEPQDVPFLMRGLYRYGLSIPHADKMRMECLISDHRDLFSGTAILRPTLLLGDGSVSVDSDPDEEKKRIRVGTVENPAIGYTIQRAAVGKWIFDEIIQKGHMDERWDNGKITLTY